jgi:hypothetical protein
MTFDEIETFVQAIPIANPYFDCVRGDLSGVQSNHALSIVKSNRAYRDLQFGWTIVRYLSDNSDSEIMDMTDNEFIVRAYNFENFGTKDKAIERAVMYTLPSRQHFSSTIKSCLLVEGITYEEISEKLGIELDTVRAFDQLFFNVTDRIKEALWLADVVYPETRFVEAMDNYHKNESFSMMLQRAGYNNGIEAVQFFSGLRSSILTSGDMANAAGKMENALMINGFLLATNGFINQRDATGIHNARTIINAEKQGGNQNESSEDITGTLGESIYGSLEIFKEVESSQLITAREQIGTVD